jgi:3-dehydrosphinganine reductase
MENNNLALITGGSSGIGLALAKRLVLEGWDVCLVSRKRIKLHAAKKELNPLLVREGQQVYLLSADVTDYSSLEKKLGRWTQDHALPDLVVNSAGVAYPGYFQDLDMEIFHWLMDVNYFGTLHTIKCLIPGMIERGSGKIVNISSQAGFVSIFGYSGYSASKFAVRALTDSIRAEMKQFGIQVSIVFPPDTDTPQLEFEEPLKPKETKALAGQSGLLTADQVADSIYRGVHTGSYIILPGFEGKVFYRLVNLLGNLQYPILDWLVSRARKQK